MAYRLSQVKEEVKNWYREISNAVLIQWHAREATQYTIALHLVHMQHI